MLHEPGRPAKTTSYMWLYRRGQDGPPIVLFDYQETRSKEHPKRFLEGFKGYLVCRRVKLPGIIISGSPEKSRGIPHRHRVG
nr:transposase [Alicyclobacillus sacchari]